MLSTKLQSCKLSKLQSCELSKLQSCKLSKLQSCKVIKLHGCKVLRLQGCKVTKLHGCKVTITFYRGVFGNCIFDLSIVFKIPLHDKVFEISELNIIILKFESFRELRYFRIRKRTSWG